MARWLFKAAVQGALSRLPNPQKCNRLFQRHVTGSLTLREDYFLQKWGQAERHLSTFAQHHGGVPSTALELGTGWFPMVPVAYALNGVAQVYTVDTQTLLSHRQVSDVLLMCQTLVRAGKVSLGGVGAAERLEDLSARASQLDVRRLLEELGITSLVTDARCIQLPDGALELVSSNNTLEHIPEDVIRGIFAEFRRLVSPSGLMSHHVDMADHYANFDTNISVYNFLRFGDGVWRWFNNELQYQNRLRVTDFRRLLEETGWALEAEDNKRDSAEKLRALPLAPEFRAYSEQDLLVYDTWLTSKPLAAV